MDVFFSYGKLSDQRNIHDDLEESSPVTRFVKMYQDHLEVNDEIFKKRAFFDRNTLVGTPITENIKQNLKECSVMVVFISPSYFQSEWCQQEYEFFIQLIEKQPEKSIVPIFLRSVSENEEYVKGEIKKKWFNDINNNWSNLIEPSDTNIVIQKNVTSELKDAISILYDRIHDAKAKVHNQKPFTSHQTSNVLGVLKSVNGPDFDGSGITKEIKNHNFAYNTDPVCVIFTGGTVGMVESQFSDANHIDYEIAQTVKPIINILEPRLAHFKCNIAFLALEKPIDSSNATMMDWYDLALIIHKQMHNFQSFVILHGTNTMAYSASALSFMLGRDLSKPVIFTGSEVPLYAANTDAIHNVENAILAAAYNSHNGPVKIPEVCVFWHNNLYRGNRVTKKYASDRTEGFHAPNDDRPLAILANDKLQVDYKNLLAPIKNSSEVADAPVKPTAKVSVIQIYPGQDFQHLVCSFPYDKVQGVIILSYGPGNPPDQPELIQLIKNLISRNIVVVNLSQCPFGKAELKLYENSAKYFDLGVIDGYDMTTEAAYCKLVLALSAEIGSFSNKKVPPKSLQNVKKEFQKNRVGELSASIHTLSINYDEFTKQGNGILTSPSSDDFLKKFDRFEINDAFLRIEQLVLPAKAKRLAFQIFYGHGKPYSRLSDDPALILNFEKSIFKNETETILDKNFEITHALRKNHDPRKALKLSIVNHSGEEHKFSAIKLVIYARSCD